jgi:two-component system nitrate/nitrite response regulator NarL
MSLLNAGISSPPVVSSLRVDPMRLLIAEDTPMGCQLLKDTIKRSRLVLASTHCATTSAQIVDLAAENVIDVALVSEDLQDGPYKGLHAVERLHATQPNIRSIVLVRSIRPQLTLDAFRNGAKGVFCRTEPIEALWKCIRAVHKGQIWADSEQLEVIMRALVQAKPMRVTDSRGTCLLTPREDEVANLVAEGLTNREVAKRLGLSEHTVSNYLFRIYDKLGISRRVEFVLFCFSRRQQNHASS